MHFCDADPKAMTSTRAKSNSAGRKHAIIGTNTNGKWPLFGGYGIKVSLHGTNGIRSCISGIQPHMKSIVESSNYFNRSNNAKDSDGSGSDSDSEFNFVQYEPGEKGNTGKENDMLSEHHDSVQENDNDDENKEDTANEKECDRVDLFETISSYNTSPSYEQFKRDAAEEERINSEGKMAVKDNELMSAKMSKSNGKAVKKTSFFDKGLATVSSYNIITTNPNDHIPSVNSASSVMNQTADEYKFLHQYPYIDSIVREDSGVIIPNKRRLARPGPFLPYIQPENYKTVPLARQLPSFSGVPFPQPWGVPTRRGKKDTATNKYPIPELTYPYTLLSQTLFKHYETCGEKHRIT